MTQEHPITPSPELVEQWCYEDGDEIRTSPRWYQRVCAKAARWGADQELEACCEWLLNSAVDGAKTPEPYIVAGPETFINALRAIRRPKPPSLKVQALKAAQRFYANGHYDCSEKEIKYDFDIIRRALESLSD